MWIKIGLIAVLLYMAISVAIYALRHKLVLPGRHDAANITPAAAGLWFEDLTIPVDAATHIHAWWVPAEQASKMVILYFHGNYELLGTIATVEAPLLHATGANALFIDYRGYGTSSPLQAMAGTTAADARAALRYLMEERHVALSDIVFAGRSIGTPIATQLAADWPGAAGLILITPITSVADVATQSWAFRYVFRPLIWLTGSGFDTIAQIASVRVPVLIVAGSRDALARPWMAEQILERANEPKSLSVIDGANHNDIMGHYGAPVLSALRAFLSRVTTDTKIV
jgi:uncharacterized protein